MRLDLWASVWMDELLCIIISPFSLESPINIECYSKLSCKIIYLSNSWSLLSSCSWPIQHHCYTSETWMESKVFSSACQGCQKECPGMHHMKCKPLWMPWCRWIAFHCTFHFQILTIKMNAEQKLWIGLRQNSWIISSIAVSGEICSVTSNLSMTDIKFFKCREFATAHMTSHVIISHHNVTACCCHAKPFNFRFHSISSQWIASRMLARCRVNAIWYITCYVIAFMWCVIQQEFII
jgi:hypothetical protein